MGQRFVDLSHVIEHNLETYPGLPKVRIGTFLSRKRSLKKYARGTSFHIGCIEMAANTGTYLDAPFHRYAGTPDIADLSLSKLVDIPGTLVQVPEHTRAINAAMLPADEISGRAVLIATGWSRHWGSAGYFDGHPFLTTDAAELLVSRGALLAGIDSLNIDDTEDGIRPAHSLLLEAGIPIVEHLTGLSQLANRLFRFFAVPAPVRGLGSFPVRAFAIVADDQAGSNCCEDG